MQEKQVKLHLGCGEKIIPDFINIDIRKLPGVDIVDDISNLNKFNKNSVDLIYSSHFFEHLFKDDAVALLKSCFRALKPGGLIRVSIPDLYYAISLYGAGKKNEMLNDYFFVEGKGSYLARHKYMYDFDLFKEALEEAGFSKITRCEFQQGDMHELKNLDIYPVASLFIEAVRGKFNE